MKIFIFGAGASKGSQNHEMSHKLRAPLMNELFNDEYDIYANQIGISLIDISYYRDQIHAGIPLEKLLTDKWQQIEKYKEESTKYAERATFGKLTFYLWNLLRNISNTYQGSNQYTQLLKKIKERDESFGLISFNYDTLLDRALRDVFGYPLSGTIDIYTKARLIKPHGSINWFLQKRAQDHTIGQEMEYDAKLRFSIASSLMYNAPVLQMANMQILDPSDNNINNNNFIAHHIFNSQYFYPLIFIPLLVKQYAFVDAFYDKVISEGKELLQQADDIFLIGYRAADEIIQEMFQNVPAGTPLHVISLNAANAEKIAQSVLKWKPDLKKGVIFPQGFTEFVGSYHTWT